MEQRIRIIWLLSLASMLLIGAGQGYWLWNQYQYTNEEYTDEILHRVTEAIVRNDSLRKTGPTRMKGLKEVHWYTTNSNIDELTDSLTGKKYTRLDLSVRAGAKLQDATTEKVSLQQITGKSSKTLTEGGCIIYEDSVILRGDKEQYDRLNLMHLVDLFRLELHYPFNLERFDSLLTAYIPELTFSCRLDSTAADSIYQWEPTVHRHGTLLRPMVEVVYPFNPLKRQLVHVDVMIPGHELLSRMGWQLAGSILMILLLAICLLFQIKTILRQRRVDELRRSFVNTMIHELKRPVQTLKMCLAYLGDRKLCNDEAMTNQIVQDSMGEVDNLSAYLQKLRNMTQADDERTSLVLRTFDFRPMLEKIIRQQHIPDTKQVTYETRFSDSLEITADSVHLSNMVSNLLENAVKYSGSTVHITVTCTVEHHRLVLSVADNGIGIPVNEQNQVFDKFYRSASLPDRTVPGIGLGLSYVKLLTEAHHGTVTLSSQPGQGTTVTLCIPQ